MNCGGDVRESACKPGATRLRWEDRRENRAVPLGSTAVPFTHRDSFASRSMKGRPAVGSELRACKAFLLSCHMRAAELMLWRIIGALLILVGVVIFISPQINYTARENIPHTDLIVKRPKTLVIPRALAVFVVGGGVLAIAVGGRRRRRS